MLDKGLFKALLGGGLLHLFAEISELGVVHTNGLSGLGVYHGNAAGHDLYRSCSRVSAVHQNIHYHVCGGGTKGHVVDAVAAEGTVQCEGVSRSCIGYCDGSVGRIYYRD